MGDGRWAMCDGRWAMGDGRCLRGFFCVFCVWIERGWALSVPCSAHYSAVLYFLEPVWRHQRWILASFASLFLPLET